MLRGWLFIACLVLSLFRLAAQPETKPPGDKVIRVGLNFGANVSNFFADDPFYKDIYNWRFRFYAAVFQDIRIAPPFYLHTEVNYSAMGTMQKVYVTDFNGDTLGRGSFKYNLHYIQVPVLAKFKFGKKTKFLCEAGPYIGFLVAAKGGIDPDFSTSTVYPLYNLLDTYYTLDAGIKAGIGVEIPILNGQTLLFGTRYTQGFTDVSRVSPRDWNSGIGFHVGYMFEL
jgi:hypothetical protein